jgi:hypothetical protein
LTALALSGAVVSAAGSATEVRPQTVYVWMSSRTSDVGLSRTTWHGPKVSRLKAGVYDVYVSDPDQEAFLALRGPGVKKATTFRFRGVQVWRLRFRPGIYELYSLMDVYGEIVRFPFTWKFAVRA